MNDESFKTYHAWLRNRSIKGYLYRRFYLYPRIWRHVDGKVIDVGCGIGDFLKLTKNSYGVDINPYNVEYCKERGLKATLINNGRIPYDDNTFDTAILDNVIEHIYDPTSLLDEVIRVTKRGGKVIVGVPNLYKFFHDLDHKVYISDDRLYCGMGKTNIICVDSMKTPTNKFLHKNFTHACRWLIYKKNDDCTKKN